MRKSLAEVLDIAANAMTVALVLILAVLLVGGNLISPLLRASAGPRPIDIGSTVTEMRTGQQTPEGEASVFAQIQGTETTNDPPGTRRVRLERYRQNDPVRIAQVLEGATDVTPGDRPFKSWQGKPFQAGDDWVKNLTVVLKNLSNRKITAVSVAIRFPESPASDPIQSDPTGQQIIGTSITLGRTPAHYVRTGDGTQELEPASTSLPLNIGTGELLTIPLAKYYDNIKQQVEAERPISDIPNCWIMISRVYFADGTQWAAHVFYKPDPAAPGKFVPTSTDEWWGMTVPIQFGRLP